MKKPVYKLLTVLLLSLTAFGCGSKDKRQEIRHGRTARAGDQAVQASPTQPTQPGQVAQPGQGGGTGLYGIITGWPQALFDEAVKGLVSATLDPNELGFVSGEANQGTGIVFKGKIELQGGPLSASAAGQRAVLPQSSHMHISIWDSFAGQTYQDERGQTQYVPEYPINFSSAQSGWVNGRRAQLVFADQYGSIQFDGQFIGGTEICDSVFEGEVSFFNNTHVLNETPAAWVLGEFFIYAADLFNCN